MKAMQRTIATKALRRRPLLAALAAASLVAALPDARALDTVEVEQQNHIEFVTGGIGDREQQRTKQLGKDMSLQTIFARPDGAYLADVDVTIKDAQGKTVLDVDSAAPLLFADLGPGRYEVIATFHGQSARREVTVPASGQEVEYFRWQTD